MSVGYARDLRPLIREIDRDQMAFAFDLWSYDDVRAAAEAILERLEEGSMPCDEPWPDEHVQLVRDWIAQGCPP